MMTNKLMLDLSEDEALKDKLSAMSPGDSIELEVVASIDEMTGKSCTLSVKEATVIEEEEPEMEDEGESEMEGGAVGESGQAALIIGSSKDEED